MTRATNARVAELENALRRLLFAYRADVAATPGLPVIISWETNGGALRAACEALGFDVEMLRDPAADIPNARTAP